MSAERAASPGRRMSTAGPRVREDELRGLQPPGAQPLTDGDLGLRRSFWWWARLAAGLAAAFLVWQLLLIARSVVSGLVAIVLLTIFAAVVALVCAPAVDALTRHARMPRTLATFAVLAGLLAAVAGLLVAISQPLVHEATALVASLPNLERRVGALQSWLTQHGFKLSNFSLTGALGGILGGGQSSLSGFAVSAVTGTFSIVVDIVVVLVGAFWMLRDHQRLRRMVLDNIPSSWRPHVDFGFRAFTVVVGGYVRAQLAMALLIATLAGVGCSVIGVPFPLVVAVAAGVFELIPLVGPFVGFGVAALLALTVNPLMVVEVAALFLAIHVIEGYLVAPRLQGRFVRIHPLVAFLALFAGVEVGGFLGALVAVPMASLLALLLRSAIGDVRALHPELFAGDGRPDGATALRRTRELRQYRLLPRHPLQVLRRRLRGGR